MLRVAVLPVLVLVLLLPAPACLAAQTGGWEVSSSVGAWSVQATGDWWALEQRARRRFPGGSLVEAGLASWRRFGRWDHALEARGTLRAGERLWLRGGVLVTPDAEIREETAVELGGSVGVPPLAIGADYRRVEYGDGTNHQVVPTVEWYAGDVFVLARGWITRTLHETTTGAALLRLAWDLSGRLRAWAGVATGEEDYVVGSPPARRVATLETLSGLAGVEVRPAPGWSARLDATVVDSDPRLDRVGAVLAVTRSF